MNDKRILIIEDEILHAKKLKTQLEELGYEHITIYKDAKEVLPFIKEGGFDLALVDIGLEDSSLNGIDLGKKISELQDVPIIFITSYSDETNIKKAIEIGSANYLVKPVSDRQLFVSLCKAFAEDTDRAVSGGNIQNCPLNKDSDSKFIKSKDYHTRIHIDNIAYIRSSGGSYIEIFTEDRKKLMVSVSLKNFIVKFGNSNLVRIHHSYAVNKNKVIKMNSKVVVLSNKSYNPIPIGKRYKKTVKLHFEMISTD